MLPETRTRWDNDLSNGEVQYLINKGYTVGELAVMYEIPRNWIKDAVTHGEIKFKQKTGQKAPDKPVTATWSDTKIKALTQAWTSPQKKEDKAMTQDEPVNNINMTIKPKTQAQTCPCCKQLVKVYKRLINKGMVADLSALHILSAPDEYMHINDFTRPHSNREIGNLKWWGLVERMPSDNRDKKSSGMYRITQKGRDFIQGKVMVRKYALVYNSECLGFDGGMVLVTDCDKNFSYSELMES